MKKKIPFKNLRCSLHMLFLNKWSLRTKIGLPILMLDAWKLLTLDLHGKKFEVDKTTRSQIWKQKEVQKNSKSMWSILDSSMTMFIMNIWKWWNHVCVIIFQYCISKIFDGLVALCSILKYRKIGIVGRNNKLASFMDFLGVG
jgi:hypothetical protein